MSNISIIACISQDRGLGYTGQLLWHIPEDMQFFKRTTMGGVVVMGSRTFASIGRPLPGRQNIVLSHHQPEHAQVTWCQDEAELRQSLAQQTAPIFIIGGASLYAMFIDQAQKLYLTEVAGQRPADTFFPDFDRSQFDRRVLQEGEDHGIKYTISEYTRKP